MPASCLGSDPKTIRCPGPRRSHVRTHLGAQSFEASLVIVDNPRSSKACHSANEDIICVLLSRMIHGMIVLQNHSLLEGQNVNQNAPFFRVLVNLFKFHIRSKALTSNLHFKEVQKICKHCYGIGHIRSECPKAKNPLWMYLGGYPGPKPTSDEPAIRWRPLQEEDLGIWTMYGSM